MQFEARLPASRDASPRSDDRVRRLRRPRRPVQHTATLITMLCHPLGGCRCAVAARAGRARPAPRGRTAGAARRMCRDSAGDARRRAVCCRRGNSVARAHAADRARYVHGGCQRGSVLAARPGGHPVAGRRSRRSRGSAGGVPHAIAVAAPHASRASVDACAAAAAPTAARQRRRCRRQPRHQHAHVGSVRAIVPS